jgi:hypothetical protein
VAWRVCVAICSTQSYCTILLHTIHKFIFYIMIYALSLTIGHVSRPPTTDHRGPCPRGT